MKARPILFSGPMIRALLDGTKTQTRRPLKKQPAGAWAAPGKTACPYGQLGDLLWVRETWGIGTRPCPHEGWVDGLEYRADDFGLDDHDLLPLHPLGAREDLDLDQYRGQWRPSIHMPRWASRLTLRVTDVRVERVQDISEADAGAEGIEVPRCPVCCYTLADCALNLDHDLCSVPVRPPSAIPVFAKLWNSINAKRGLGWDVNPWVWALTFEVIEKNVDQVLADPTPRTAP